MVGVSLTLAHVNILQSRSSLAGLVRAWRWWFEVTQRDSIDDWLS